MMRSFKMKDKAKQDFRENLTNKIVKQIEEGTAPWQKPWDEGAIPISLPYNGATGRRYRGCNIMSLMAQGYSDPRWCTYKQAAEKGWQVRKGEKSTVVEYWMMTDDEIITDEKGEKRTVRKILNTPLVFYSRVFNVEQINNVPPIETPKREVGWSSVETAEKILQESKAIIKHLNQDSAYYSQSRDEIHLPPKSAFPDASKYYATALHELGHWTGHESRLNRDLSGGFGSENYAREELRVEMASLFLSAELGLPFDPSRHAAYQASWIKALKEDKNEVFRAARDAEIIADYVLGLGLEKNIEKIQDQETSKSLASNTAISSPAEQKQASLNEATRHIREGLQAKGMDENFKVVPAESVNTGGKFSGEISAVTDSYVVQKIGANKYVAHDRSNLPDKKFEVGKYQTLQYSQGKAQLIDRDIKKSVDKSISR